MADGAAAHHEREPHVPVGLQAAAKDGDGLHMVAAGDETRGGQGCTEGRQRAGVDEANGAAIWTEEVDYASWADGGQVCRLRLFVCERDNCSACQFSGSFFISCPLFSCRDSAWRVAGYLTFAAHPRGATGRHIQRRGMSGRVQRRRAMRLLVEPSLVGLDAGGELVESRGELLAEVLQVVERQALEDGPDLLIRQDGQGHLGGRRVVSNVRLLLVTGGVDVREISVWRFYLYLEPPFWETPSV